MGFCESFSFKALGDSFWIFGIWIGMVVYQRVFLNNCFYLRRCGSLRWKTPSGVPESLTKITSVVHRTLGTHRGCPTSGPLDVFCFNVVWPLTFSDWWLQTWLLFSIIYGMSSFPLTFIFFRGVQTTNQFYFCTLLAIEVRMFGFQWCAAQQDVQMSAAREKDFVNELGELRRKVEGTMVCGCWWCYQHTCRRW